MEAQLSNGLIIGHAYSVTDVRYVSPSVFSAITAFNFFLSYRK